MKKVYKQNKIKDPAPGACGLVKKQNVANTLVRKSKLFAMLLLLLSTAGLKAAPLSGAYTINALVIGPTNYTTFTLAVADLTAYGVSGPVVFTAAAATFTESITIGAITGVSATNTITFRGAGKYAPTPTLLTSATNTVTLTNASFVTFDQMNIVTSETAGNLINATTSTSCAITNCIVKGPLLASATALYLIYDYTATSLTVKNCYIYGGNYGIYSIGTQGTATYGFLQCTNNSFIAQYTVCYYLRDVQPI